MAAGAVNRGTNHLARRRQSVTIKHVAADAGVSLQTVSRVINDEPNVRPAMRTRVLGSIEKLGYVPSIAAQRMSGSRSYLIVALNDRERTLDDWRRREGKDWVDQMLLGGMLACAEHGYRMVIELVDTHADHVERELNAALTALQPDGVILTPPHGENPRITGFLAERQIPFVRIGAKDAGPGFAIDMGDEEAAREATHHLAHMGHRRIGFIGGSPEYRLSRWREDGWRQGMNQFRLSARSLYAPGDFSYESGLQAARALLSVAHPPTAIIAGNDQMALAALQVARDMGLDVPGDLSLVSFDNSPVVRLTQPPLTAIDQPIADTAALAARLLIAARRDPEQPATHTVPARLIPRASTAPPPPGR